MARRNWPTPGGGPSAVKKELASKAWLAPIRLAESTSTISARAAPLASPIGIMVPASAALGSAVGRPSGSSAQPSGMGWPVLAADITLPRATRSEEHTSELQSLMRISYAVFCLKKKKQNKKE